jgi:glyoxylase-like metal-dependent hydrolase (beta-lactamase superfamily II)
MDRRTFVGRTALTSLSVLGLSAGLNAGEAGTATPPASASTPAVPVEPDIYAFQFGGSKAFVILDGVLPFTGVKPLFAPEATQAQLDEQLQRNFISTDKHALCVNVLVLQTRSGVVLFDAGAGSAFGPSAGRLLRGLARIAVRPEEVKIIYVTHAHADHVSGLADSAGAPVFPSARIVTTKTETTFWTSDSPDVSGMRLPPEELVGVVRDTKNLLGHLQSKLELHEPGKLSAEVELMAAPGHTPGHAFYLVKQGSESLLVMGDSVHVEWLQFEHPEWTIAWDVNPRQAVATRRKLLEQLASNKGLAFGCHMPFPGIGHVRAVGGAFEWVPRPWA